MNDEGKAGALMDAMTEAARASVELEKAKAATNDAESQGLDAREQRHRELAAIDAALVAWDRLEAATTRANSDGGLNGHAAESYTWGGTTMPEARADRAQDEVLPWADPTPLPDPLPPVAPFRLDLLPVHLQPWIGDIAMRMQCPMDYPAAAALVALSSLIGARAVLLPKCHDSSWRVTCNLWGLCVGRPGVMKSPALREVLHPLMEFEAAAALQWERDVQAWGTDHELAELQAEARKNAAKGVLKKDPTAMAAARAKLLSEEMETSKPTPKRFVMTDATMEKLGEVLATHPYGLLAYRDELHGLLLSLDKQGQEGARAFFLQAADGNQGYTFDRIMRGTVRIPRVCLSMLGSIQPGKLESYVRAAMSGAGDDGLLQRFGLLVWPDPSPDFVNVDTPPDEQAHAQARAIFLRLSALQPGIEGAPVVWRLDDEAQHLCDAWRVSLEHELRAGELHPALESHLAKHRKTIPALALVFAMIDGIEGERVVRADDMRRAIEWATYLRSHAERLYSVTAMPETGAAAVLLARIQAGTLADGFTPREVTLRGWAALKSPAEVRAAAQILVDFDWLRRIVRKPPGGGRPSEGFLINPSAFADARVS